jgi:hypothetical protein
MHFHSLTNSNHMQLLLYLRLKSDAPMHVDARVAKILLGRRQVRFFFWYLLSVVYFVKI